MDAQWLLTKEEYASLATFKRCSEAEEAESRYKAATLIQKVGMLLKL